GRTTRPRNQPQPDPRPSTPRTQTSYPTPCRPPLGHLVVVAARRRRWMWNVGMALAPVKAALRRGQSSYLGIHEVRRNLHEIRGIGPHQSGPQWPAGKQLCEHGAVEGHLANVGGRYLRDSLWRRVVGLVVGDQDSLLGDHQPVDLARYRN